MKELLFLNQLGVFVLLNIPLAFSLSASVAIIVNHEFFILSPADAYIENNVYPLDLKTIGFRLT